MTKAYLILGQVVKVLIRFNKRSVYYVEYKYDDQVLDKLYTVFKKLHVNELCVLFDSIISSENFQNGFVVSETHSGDQTFRNYVSKTDLCKIIHLVRNMKIDTIHCWDRITYVTTCIDSGCAVFASNDIYCLLVIQNHIPVDVIYTRIDQVSKALIKINMTYQINNFINADNLIDINYVQNIEDFLEIGVAELLPVLNACGYMKGELDCNNVDRIPSWLDISKLGDIAPFAIISSKNSEEVDNKIDASIENVFPESKLTNFRETDADAISNEEMPVTVVPDMESSNSNKLHIKRIFVDSLLTILLVVIVICTGAAFGISKVINNEIDTIKVEIDSMGTMLDTLKVKNDAINLDSNSVIDIYTYVLQIPINGLVGGININSDKVVTVLFYLRDTNISTIEQTIKAVDANVQIENQGTINLQDTTCYKYQVSFIYG